MCDLISSLIDYQSTVRFHPILRWRSSWIGIGETIRFRILLLLYSPYRLLIYVDAICIIGTAFPWGGGGRCRWHTERRVHIVLYIYIYSWPGRVNVVNQREIANTNAQKPIRNWKRLFLFPPPRGPDGGLLSNFRKFIKPRVVAVAAETYNSNHINIQLCVKCVRIRRIWFFDCVVVRGARGGSHRGGRGFMAFAHGTTTPLFTGTNWTTHYRPQTANERVVGQGLVAPTGVPVNAHHNL